MRRAVPAFLAVFLAAFVTMAALMTPATAETGSTSDPGEDATPRIDITGLTVKNADRRVTFEIDVQQLRRKGVFTFYYWGGTTGTPPARSALLLVRHIDDQPHLRFFACGTEDCAPEPCVGLRVDWDSDADEIVASMPQRCYPRPPSDPDAAAPAVGRFYASSRLGDDTDTTGPLLQLQRG